MHHFQVDQVVCLKESWEITTPDGPILLPAGLTGEITSIGRPDYPNYGKVVAVRFNYYGHIYEVGTWVDLILDVDEYRIWQGATYQ